MRYNTLFLTNTIKDTPYTKYFDEYSQNFIVLNYFNLLKHTNYRYSHQLIETKLQEVKINLLIIEIHNCDTSLDIYFLQKMKQQYNLMIIFLFFSSQNSFEYIDRYYSQLGDINIIQDIPYIQEFYELLKIPCLKIDTNYFSYLPYTKEKIDFNITHIKKNNLFASSLSSLSIEPHTKYYYKKYSYQKHLLTQKYMLLYQKRIITCQIRNIFEILQKQTSQNIILDDKFLDAQNIYKIFWILYHVTKNHRITFLEILNLIKHPCSTYKIYKILKNTKISNSKHLFSCINQSLYKEYKI